MRCALPQGRPCVALTELSCCSLPACRSATRRRLVRGSAYGHASWSLGLAPRPALVDRYRSAGVRCAKTDDFRQRPTGLSSTMDSVLPSRRPHMISNRASRWSSVVYILIGLAGAYGLLTDLAWPPTPMVGFIAVSLILIAVVAVRSLRSGILVDTYGLISRADVTTRRLCWAEIVRFEARGSLLANQVGAVLVDRRWVPLQYHPYADDYVKLLQQARLTYASEADLQVAADAAAHYVALPAQHSRRRIFTWRFCRRGGLRRARCARSSSRCHASWRGPGDHRGSCDHERVAGLGLSTQEELALRKTVGLRTSRPTMGAGSATSASLGSE